MKPESNMAEEDRRLIEQIRRGYAPPPMSEMERSRFDARLRARVERHRRRRLGLMGLGLAGAAAAVALFALQPSAPPGSSPGPQPEMAATPAADGGAELEAIAMDWLVEDSAADWLGGSTVLPSDPLALPALGDETGAVAAADDGDDEATEQAADDDTSPTWMPEQYTVLAALIEIDPYDAYDSYDSDLEDWP